MIRRTVRVCIRGQESAQESESVDAAKQRVEAKFAADPHADSFFAEVEVTIEDLTPASGPDVDTLRPLRFERHIFEPRPGSWRQVQ